MSTASMPGSDVTFDLTRLMMTVNRVWAGLTRHKRLLMASDIEEGRKAAEQVCQEAQVHPELVCREALSACTELLSICEEANQPSSAA